jgi:hypothetical protein
MLRFRILQAIGFGKCHRCWKADAEVITAAKKVTNTVGTREAGAADAGACTICEMQENESVLQSCPCGGSGMSPQLRIRQVESQMA